MGFKTKSVIVAGQSSIDVVLEVDTESLEEVVVVGYGTQKKSHLTGSISKVTNDDLDQIAVSRVDDALVGQVSGVNIQATDAEAGAAPTITIRGVGSMAGDSTPLIVVDGVIVDSDFLGSLNMNDVESFEVLKDAASSSIFGSKGSNGIIMITMKSGVEGKPKFTYNGLTGLKSGRKSDAYGYTTQGWADQQLAENGVLNNYTAAQLQIVEATGIDRSWQDVLIDGGVINSHSLSVRGGNAKTKYAASMNYLNDEGVLLVDNFERFGARAKVDVKVNKKVSFGINFAPTYSIRRRASLNLYNGARHQPWLPIYHTEETLNFYDYTDADLIEEYGVLEPGDYAMMRHFVIGDLDGDGVYTDENLTSNWGNSNNQNPYAKNVERDRNDKKLKLFSSAYAKFKLAKGLNFKSSLSASFQDTQRKDFLGTEATRLVTNASITQIAQKDQYYIADNFLNYDKKYGKNEFALTLGNTIEKRNYFYNSTVGQGFLVDEIAELTNAPIPTEIDGFEWTKRGISFVSRLNYAYDDKYLMSLSYRRDGSSIFARSFKYGDFPAASIGWNVDKEDFLSSSNVLSKLKLRASYGVTGNDRLNTGAVDPDAAGSTSSLSTGNILVDYYPHLDLISPVSFIQDGQIASGFGQANIGNADLQWERLIEINPGIDFGFFGNRISGSIDWYQRTSDQLLLNNPVSYTSGYTNVLQNLGEVKNEGWELELRTKNITNDKFKWSTTFLATINENTLVDFGDSNGQITSLDPKRPTEWINLEGQPISSFYGYVVDREVPTEELTQGGNFHRYVGQKSGVAYVKDLNGDGVLDDEDKTILGNPYPKLIWSFGNDFSYGPVDFSFLFQGSHGAEVRNIADEYLFNYDSMDEVLETVDSEFIVHKRFTNDIIQDASYIALRNVNIGLNLPQGFLDATGLSKARVYTSGQNLLYFTADGYTGWNPEALDKTSPTQYGYQRGGSPITRTISLGFNIDF